MDNKDYYLATWTGIGGDRWYLNAPGEDFPLVDNPWLDQNVRQGHGPLGELYPRVAYIMEGDTPSFLNLISNGLASQEDPPGAVGVGAYVLRQSYGESRPIYTNSRDLVQTRDGKLHRSNNNGNIWRHGGAFPSDSPHGLVRPAIRAAVTLPL